MAIRVIAAVLARVLRPLHLTITIAIRPSWMVLVPRVRVAALRVAIRVITTRNRSAGVSPLVVPPRLVAATVVAPNTVVAAFCPVAVDDPAYRVRFAVISADRQSVGGGCYPGGRPSIQTLHSPGGDRWPGPSGSPLAEP